MEDETEGEKLERLKTRLNACQRTFCEEFLKHADSSAAYSKAYSTGKPRASVVSQLLGKWYIQDYLNCLAKCTDTHRYIITEGEVLSHLASMLRDDKAKDQDRVASAKVIAHVRGFGVKKVEHSGNPDRPVKVQGASEADLLRMRREFAGMDPEGV